MVLLLLPINRRTPNSSNRQHPTWSDSAFLSRSVRRSIDTRGTDGRVGPGSAYMSSAARGRCRRLSLHIVRGGTLYYSVGETRQLGNKLEPNMLNTNRSWERKSEKHVSIYYNTYKNSEGGVTPLCHVFHSQIHLLTAHFPSDLNHRKRDKPYFKKPWRNELYVMPNTIL